MPPIITPTLSYPGKLGLCPCLLLHWSWQPAKRVAIFPKKLPHAAFFGTKRVMGFRLSEFTMNRL